MEIDFSDEEKIIILDTLEIAIEVERMGGNDIKYLVKLIKKIEKSLKEEKVS